MNSNVIARRLGWLILALLPALSSAAESASENPREESWQIEQRQRWFEESRGLREHPEAAQLRADAAAVLKQQRLALDPLRSASGESWQEIGPSSMNMVDWIMGRVAGRLNAITPLPGDDNTVYAGSAAGGVWKTTNGGQSWTPVFDQVGTLPVGAIT
ncbi:MAG: hypothetical protein KDI72_12700, partial [Xanthomonadales bacterium]|nr:hypothetical protein [Xanthomonadales bacterium]MCB1576412.1 hypothetical protein [Xanthomonadales bacterium]